MSVFVLKIMDSGQVLSHKDTTVVSTRLLRYIGYRSEDYWVGSVTGQSR